MAAECIVGAQWGDEGKGKVIDYFARKADYVVRWAGGGNAGHTILLPDGRKFVLHLLPAGVFHQGVVNVLGAGVVLDPWQVLAEMDALERAGLQVDPSRLRISPRAHLVLPWHKALDQAREKGGRPGRIGTTGKGIGPCYEDKAARRGVRVADLASREGLASSLEELARERNLLLESLYGQAPIDPTRVESSLLEVREKLLPFVEDAGLLLRKALGKGKSVLFEGAQGVLLDLDHGTYPFVTSSSASSGGVFSGAGIPFDGLDRVIGVAKAYTTRVGEGPFPSELHGEAGERLRKAGGEFGATTGRPRRCGWLDCAALRYSLALSGAREMVLTKLDVLSGQGPLKILASYEGMEG
ncbi:MAG TPA: adenylosuccinate synthase, partial [Planctomycetes bacterium]|nr:adenylosuccinate synthase [Planctomycetota bacterium]